ncbi:hypothetical protein MANES_12G157300v8 [Manihot esculenta]|uniref:Uncharacterized protein n=1 Tax=Manihot esculenta TaxID=3983 RepID=A0ACB7GRL8_MANES|nr:hypothetical protein MANES_12G157300v8 [Manihot esculenta]
MGFEAFEPIYGEPKVEWAKTSDSDSVPLRRFLMQIFAPDYYNLKIQVTDYHSNTFASVKSIMQLEDMRDSIGIGGSWSDFVDYFVASVKSEDVKLVLEKHSHAYEQGCTSQLTKVTAIEKDDSGTIHSQLEKRQKLQKTNSSDKTGAFAPSNNGSSNSPDKQSARDPVSKKVANRVVPAYRRAKVRGALLQDTEDDKDN